MNEDQRKMMHDLSNKLTSMDGKVRRIRKAETLDQAKEQLEKLEEYRKEAQEILMALKSSLVGSN